MKKETVQNETYLGLEIYWLYMKCPICYTEISMKTDPKNNDYIMENNAKRLYEAYKDYKY